MKGGACRQGIRGAVMKQGRVGEETRGRGVGLVVEAVLVVQRDARAMCLGQADCVLAAAMHRSTHLAIWGV